VLRFTMAKLNFLVLILVLLSLAQRVDASCFATAGVSGTFRIQNIAKDKESPHTGCRIDFFRTTDSSSREKLPAFTSGSLCEKRNGERVDVALIRPCCDLAYTDVQATRPLLADDQLACISGLEWFVIAYKHKNQANEPVADVYDNHERKFTEFPKEEYEHPAEYRAKIPARALLLSSPAICDRLRKASEILKCKIPAQIKVLNEALLHHDLSLCQRLSPPDINEGRYSECMMANIAYLHRSELCEPVFFKRDPSPEQSLYMSCIKSSGQSKMCDDLKDSIVRNACFTAFFRCSEIKLNAAQRQCYSGENIKLTISSKGSEFARSVCESMGRILIFS
jgi:hypothetical protein